MVVFSYPLVLQVQDFNQCFNINGTIWWTFLDAKPGEMCQKDCGLGMAQGVPWGPRLVGPIMIFGHSVTEKVMRGAQSWWVLIKHDINTSYVLDLGKEFKCLKRRGVGINELWRKEMYLRCLWIGRGWSSYSIFKTLKLLCRSFFLSKESLKAPAVLSTCQGCNDGNFVSLALHNRDHYVMVNFSVCSVRS